MQDASGLSKCKKTSSRVFFSFVYLERFLENYLALLICHQTMKPFILQLFDSHQINKFIDFSCLCLIFLKTFHILFNLFSFLFCFVFVSELALTVPPFKCLPYYTLISASIIFAKSFLARSAVNK